MNEKIEAYYQRLIIEDIDKPRYVFFRKYFRFFIVGFFALQIYYYFEFFHGRINRVILYIRFFHEQRILTVPPKAVMFAYDELLLFLFYLFSLIMVSVLSFIAFDSAQRSKIIRRLKNDR